jgi:ABC-type amino acid transport substrate-binding protein
VKYIILTLISMFSLSVFSGEPSLKIATMDLKPYGWEDDAREKHGIIYEMNQEIGKRMKVSFTNKIYPFNRMLKLLSDGQVDIISSQAHKASIAAGEKLAIQFDINVIAGTSKGSGISKISDFKNKQIIYHNSASYKELEGLPRNIIRVDSYLQSLAILARKNHSDGAVFSEPAYYYWMKVKGLSPRDFGNVVMIRPNKKQWIFVRRDLPRKMKVKIKKVVNDIYKEKLYQKLLSKYGKD